jgi:hypothetical protein
MATHSTSVARYASDAGQDSVKHPGRGTAIKRDPSRISLIILRSRQENVTRSAMPLVIDGPGVIDTLADVEAAIAMRQQANNSTPK